MTRLEIPIRLIRPDELRLGRETGELLPGIRDWCDDNVTGTMRIAIERETHATGSIGAFSIAAFAEFERDLDAVAFKMVWL